MRLIARLVACQSARWFAIAGAAVALLGGCQAVAITAAGIGASTGLSHTANSIGTRTFTANEQQVKQATLAALTRMGMKLDSVSKGESVETLRASLADRNVEIEVEVLNESTTRITASAQRGLFLYDGATAREIIAQTELAMLDLTAPRRARAPTKLAPALADSTMSVAPIRR
jgi:lipoprotein-anchoring transpeptidase ErfK/SrfK